MDKQIEWLLEVKRTIESVKGTCKVLVCGSRNFDNKVLMHKVLEHFKSYTLVHGAARGADLLSERHAKFHTDNYPKTYTISVKRYPAYWERNGKQAGFIRNREMAKRERPDICIAFYQRSKTPGTADMVSVAKSRCIPTFEFGLKGA